jgi:hypothetical protein
VRLLELIVSQVLVSVWIVEVFVALPYREQYLTAFITKLCAFKPQAVIIIDIHLCPLCLLGRLIVNKEVGSVLSIEFGLFHPNRAHFPILTEDLLNQCLRR